MGIGCQLNNYVLATIVAMYTNRRLVILPGKYMSTSRTSQGRAIKGGQFGCLSRNMENDESRGVPSGLNLLLNIPDWIGGACEYPCGDTYDYAYLESFSRSKGRNSTTCKDGRGRSVSVLPLNADGIRGFAMDEFYFWLKREEIKNATFHSALYSRLGATPTESGMLSAKGNITWRKREVWDQIVSLLNRRSMITFQPWITRDVNARIRQVGLPKDYIAVHVRRGDKLHVESRDLVQKFWMKRGYNASTQPTNYIPFSFYLEQLKEENQSLDTTTVYVATDDPATVKQEIANLTSTQRGHYNFVMNPDEAATTGHHVHSVDGDCSERYNKTVAAVADLTILSQARTFVGDFSSNWGRLVRTMRTSFTDDTMGTGKPRDFRNSFGNWQPPGW